MRELIAALRLNRVIVVDQSAFLLDLGILVVSALLLGILFVKLKLPVVSAYVLAGMLVSPSVLGLVKDPTIVDDAASIGIILLLFVLGLELDPDELRKAARYLLPLTAMEVAIAFTSAFAAAFLLHLPLLESLVFAMTASISSTAIVGKVFLERGMVREEQSKLMVGLLVTEDIVAVAFLTVISSIGSPSAVEVSFLRVFAVGLGGVAILLLGYGVARYFAPYAVNYLSHYEGELVEIPFLFALALGFAFGVLASYFGYSPGTGAFVIGLSMRGKQSKFLTTKLSTIKDLFLVLFFVSMGGMIDPYPSLMLGLPMLLLMASAVAGKFAGGYGVGRVLASRLGHATRPVVFGVSLIPRGEFSFVIGQLALSLGIISNSAFSLIGLTVVVTALVGPLLQRFVEPRIAESKHPSRPERDP